MGLRISRRSRFIWLSRPVWNRRVLFLLGALAVGLACVGFALAATRANLAFHSLLAVAPWASFIVVPAGLGAIRWLTGRWFPGAEGSGIPQTIASLQLNVTQRSQLLSLRVAFAKVGLTVLGLLSGASIGREGPSVQVGASIMHALSRFASFPYAGMQRGLILAGGAAGVAAAFNAPLAGVVFAIEEMSRSFEHRTASIVITAVVVSGIVALALQGDYAYFGQTSVTVDLGHGAAAVIVCGLIGGLAGGAFSRLLLALNRRLPGALHDWRAQRPVLFAAGCGLVLALIGALASNSTFGTGYEETRAMLEGGNVVHGFGLFKLAATVVSYLSGIPGGIFAPSLAVGAGLGRELAPLMPGVPVAALIILGMVGYFCGVVQAPLTAFVIVVEMTRDSAMALPLMACALLAFGVSRVVCPIPLYKGLAKAFMQRARLA